ncbi:MAG: hypothetical protein ACJAS1_002669 [Oleiphilaceae bacterium]
MESSLSNLNEENQAVVLNNEWLTEKLAAEYLNVSASFLAKNRCYGQGSEIIPYVRLSKRCIRYNYYQLQSWLEEQIQAFKTGDVA